MGFQDLPLHSITPRRQRSRLTTQIPARLTTLSGSASIILLDLSLTGARVELPDECCFLTKLDEGTDAVVEWYDFEGFGKLAWIRPTATAYEAGVQFDEIIKPQTLITTRDRYDEFCRKGGISAVTREVVRKWVQGR